MSYPEALEPADAFWQTVEEWNLADVTAEDLVGSVESRIGRPLEGHQRTDLLSLAEGEIEYNKGTSRGA